MTCTRHTLLSVILSTLLCGCAGSADPPRRQSLNIRADIHRMWETEALRSRPGEIASTERAINAADRVFSTVQLHGTTRRQVIALLGGSEAFQPQQLQFPFLPIISGRFGLPVRYRNGRLAVQHPFRQTRQSQES